MMKVADFVIYWSYPWFILSAQGADNLLDLQTF